MFSAQTRFAVFGLLVVVLAIAASTANAVNSPTCFVTSQMRGEDQSTQNSHPMVRLVINFPGNLTIVGDTTDARDFYRTSFFFYNASNDEELFPDVTDPTIVSSLGGSNIYFDFTNYVPLQVASVKVKYTQLPFAPIKMVFNGTDLTSLDITCAPHLLTTAYAAVLDNGYVSVYFSRPVKPCWSNGTDILTDSWFTLATKTCTGNTVPCTGLRTTGLCNNTGLQPVNNRRMVYYCQAHNNFSSLLTAATYTIAADKICDVGTNKTVNSYGNAEILKLPLYPALDVNPHDGFRGFLLPSADDPGAYDHVLLDVGYPILSWTNYSSEAPYVVVKFGQGLNVMRCTPSHQMAETLIVYGCPEPFRPVSGETVTYAVVGRIYHSIPGSGTIRQNLISTDDEYDAGLTALVPRGYELMGAYRVSTTTLRVDLSSDTLGLPRAANFIVYLASAVTQYTVTNVTRRSGSTFYLNFNTANALPEDVPLRVYHIGGIVAENNAPWMSKAIDVEDSEPEVSTAGDINDLPKLTQAFVYMGFVALVIVALQVANYAFCKSKGRSKAGYSLSRGE